MASLRDGPAHLEEKGAGGCSRPATWPAAGLNSGPIVLWAGFADYREERCHWLPIS